MFNQLKFKLILKFQWLSFLFNGNDGFDFKKQKEEEKDPNNYVFGASPLIKKVLKEDGQWQPPQEEPQSGRLETMGCTGYAALSIMEILHRDKYEKEPNYSDRFVNKMSGTSRNGNSMKRVLDSIRKHHGVVNQEDWENKVGELNWEQYYAPIPKDVLDKGLMWLKDYEVGYENVYRNRTAMLEALKFSPLYVAVYAWYQKDGIYIGIRNPNHATTLIGGNADYGIVFDSYAPYIKKVAWDNIHFPRIITLNKKGKQFDKKKVQKLMERGLKYLIQVPRGELWKLSKDGLEYQSGQKLTDDIIKLLEIEGKITGISDKDFNNLLQ